MSDPNADELREFWNASQSDRELVLKLENAISVVRALPSLGKTLLGWECWIRESDGKLTHSKKHMGSAGDVGGIELVERLMRLSADEHLKSPETPNAELLFCLTLD